MIGLGRSRPTSLEEIERRRLELWIVTTIVVALVGGGLLLVAATSTVETPLPTSILYGGLVVTALAFCAYAIEKEFHLRRLTRALLDERMLTRSLTDRVSELSGLLDASHAMNSVLDLEEVLDIILASAIDLLGGAGGSVMLVEDGDNLRAICTRGNPGASGAVVRFGEGIAGRVAVSLEPVLVTGEFDRERVSRVESSMSVPLVHRENLLGVLNVNAGEGRTFDHHDLRPLTFFAEQAAGAIANARLYKTEQDNVARLEDIDRLKNEFIASVNHDLRTPLTLLLGGSALARREGVSEQERDRFLEAIERQAKHLASMIDSLLSTAELERKTLGKGIVDVDVADVVRTLADDFEAVGRPVTVTAPSQAMAIADEPSLRRVLFNLVDNAHKHGEPPVDVRVEGDGSGVEISVCDRGPGIAQDQRDRIFDRFVRLDPNRSRPGMGLGLSIVKSIVDSFGGAIDVEGLPEGGTRFVVKLDVAPQIATADSPDRSATA